MVYTSEESNIIEPEVAQRVPRTRSKGLKHTLFTFLNHFGQFRLVGFYINKLCFFFFLEKRELLFKILMIRSSQKIPTA